MDLKCSGKKKKKIFRNVQFDKRNVPGSGRGFSTELSEKLINLNYIKWK